MKTLLLALSSAVCFLVGIVCLHLMLNYKQWLKQTSSKTKTKTKAKNSCSSLICANCPGLMCRKYSSRLCKLMIKDDQVAPVWKVLVPSVFVLAVVLIVQLTFQWDV